MATQICMPRLSDTMTEGGLVRWFVSEGDTVVPGQVIAELETDKSSVDLEAESAGRITKLAVAEGSEGVAVGAVLAELEEGEAGEQRTVRSERAVESSPAASSQVTQAPAKSASLEPGTPSAAVPNLARAAAAAADTLERPASPLARRMASQSGLDLGGVAGTGPHGKILKADVENALGIAASAQGRSPNNASSQPLVPAKAVAERRGPRLPSSSAPFEDERPSRTRRVIAERLSAAKREVPHFYLSADIEVSSLVALRRDLKERRADLGLTLNDFMVRALALALMKVPEANVAWVDDKIRHYQRVDLAVAVESDAGLVTPVVADAASLSLAQLSAAIADLATRARAGKLAPEEYAGGSATISNLGMYGVSSLYPILNPPQALIVGVGAAEERPVVRAGKVEAGRVLTLTLSGDHRAIDGATGAKVLAAMRALIEEPLALLV